VLQGLRQLLVLQGLRQLLVLHLPLVQQVLLLRAAENTSSNLLMRMPKQQPSLQTNYGTSFFSSERTS
jgi:hypothetical protein